MLEDDFKNTRRHSKCNASRGGAFEFKVNAILCWAGCGKTQHLKCFARPSLRKHSRATLIFPSKSRKTVNAILCWAGSSKCNICLSPAFSVLLRTVLCACLSRTHWKTVNAILCKAKASKTWQMQYFARLNPRNTQ